MRKQRSFYLSPGVISLLGVFFIFCLIAFAVLSYNTATNDKMMADRAAMVTTAYYEAQSKAEETLAMAVDAWESQDQPGLSALGVKVEPDSGGNTFKLQIPMDNKRVLSYEVLLKTDGSIIRNTTIIME